MGSSPWRRKCIVSRKTLHARGISRKSDTEKCVFLDEPKKYLAPIRGDRRLRLELLDQHSEIVAETTEVAVQPQPELAEAVVIQVERSGLASGKSIVVAICRK